MGLIEKARTGTGLSVQIIGYILWVGSGLAAFIWALWALFDAFGAWTIIIALLLTPITYLAAIFIVWFSTGIFPIIVLILWLLSWVGAGIAYVGGRISGED
jgi:phosphoglycerol transferase MdoB-like AlkP superfamily enzyme